MNRFLDYIYDHNARQRKLEELRRRKYDPLAAIASAKAMEEARKEKAKREAQPKKEDFYPSDDEEETTITSTPAPTGKENVEKPSNDIIDAKNRKEKDETASALTEAVKFMNKNDEKQKSDRSVKET